MILAGMIGLLVGALIGGLAARLGVFQKMTGSLQAASDGFKEFSRATTDDEKQRLSKKLGVVLISQGLKSLAVFAATLAVFLAPLWLAFDHHETQFLYVASSALSGIVAFGKFQRVAG